jgi:hypothetical protein
LSLLLATPVQAHCFTVWRYPWRQNCHAKYVYVPQPGPLQYQAPLPPQPRPEPEREPEQIKILLPFLSDDQQWAPEGDDHLRGIALLRSLYNAQ